MQKKQSKTTKCMGNKLKKDTACHCAASSQQFAHQRNCGVCMCENENCIASKLRRQSRLAVMYQMLIYFSFGWCCCFGTLLDRKKTATTSVNHWMPCIAMHPKRKRKIEREMCRKMCASTTCIGKYINKTIKFAKFIHLLCDQLHCSRMRAAHYHVHTLPHNCYFVLFISFIRSSITFK